MRFSFAKGFGNEFPITPHRIISCWGAAPRNSPLDCYALQGEGKDLMPRKP